MPTIESFSSRSQDVKLAKQAPPSKHFSLDDEEKEPFGLIVELPSPFVLQCSSMEELTRAKEVALAFQEMEQQVAQTFSCMKENGVETTTFALNFPTQEGTEPLHFTVKSFDTAQMQIQIELDGSLNVLNQALHKIPALYAAIAASVYPYELFLTLPASFGKEPFTSSSIKKLSEEQKTVYGVNEDEQAP